MLVAVVLAAALTTIAACSETQTATDTPRPPTAALVPVDGGLDAGDPYVPGFGATGYDVTDYDLDVTWTPPDHLRGVATITLVPNRALRSFALDLDGLRAGPVTVDRSTATVRHEGIDLTITPPRPAAAGKEATVVIAYGGRPRAADVAPHLEPVGWWRSHDLRIALGQPVGSSTWFPANETLADKATWHLTVTVPRDLEAVANGLLEDVATSTTTTTWSWAMDQPMAPSLALLAIGRFDRRADEGPRGLPILNATSEGWPGARRFTATPTMIETFEERFGPYPFAGYGVLQVDAGFPYALEAQGRSFLPAGPPMS